MSFEQIIVLCSAVISIIMLFIAFFVFVDLATKEMQEMNKNLRSLTAAFRGKAEPMKPKIKEVDTPRKERVCPVCGKSVFFFSKYCEKCGQPLDWEEDKQ